MKKKRFGEIPLNVCLSLPNALVTKSQVQICKSHQHHHHHHLLKASASTYRRVSECPPMNFVKDWKRTTPRSNNEHMLIICFSRSWSFLPGFPPTFNSVSFFPVLIFCVVCGPTYIPPHFQLLRCSAADAAGLTLVSIYTSTWGTFLWRQMWLPFYVEIVLERHTTIETEFNNTNTERSEPESILCVVHSLIPLLDFLDMAWEIIASWHDQQQLGWIELPHATFKCSKEGAMKKKKQRNSK